MLGILRKDPHLVNCFLDRSGDTVLFRSLDHVEQMKALLSFGADVKHENATGSTCLHLAVKNNRMGAVALLVQAGADISKSDSSEKSPLIISFDIKTVSEALGMMRLLVELGANPNDFHTLRCALFHKEPEILRQLIKLGGDVNLIDAESGRALVHTVEYPTHSRKGSYPSHGVHSTVQQLQRLIDCGVEINKIDNNDCSALHYAVSHGCLEAGTLLLRSGAEPDLPMRHNPPALFTALRVSPMLLEPLLLAGADPDQLLPGGDRPLHYAARTDLLNVVSLLLQYGANPRLLNAEGKLPQDCMENSLRARTSALNAMPTKLS